MSSQRQNLRPSLLLIALSLFATAAAMQAQLCSETMPLSGSQRYLRGLQQVNIDPSLINNAGVRAALQQGGAMWNSGCASSSHIPNFASVAGGGNGINIVLDNSPMAYDPVNRTWSPANWNPTNNTITLRTTCGTPPAGIAQFAYCNGTTLNWANPNMSVFAAHELGHALGLEHDQCNNGLMNEVLNGSPSNYGIHPDNCTLANFFNCDPTQQTCPNDPRGISYAEVKTTGLQTPETLLVSFDQYRSGNFVVGDAVQFFNGDATMRLNSVQLLKIGDTFTTGQSPANFPVGKTCSINPQSGSITSADTNRDRFTLDVKCCAGTGPLGLVGCNGGHTVGGQLNFLGAAGGSVGLGLTAVPPPGSTELPIQDSVGPYAGSASFGFAAEIPDGWSWRVQATDVPMDVSCVGFNNSGTISGQNHNGSVFTCTFTAGFGSLGPFLPENIPPALRPWSSLAGSSGLFPWNTPIPVPGPGGENCVEQVVCTTFEDGSQECETTQVCTSGVYAGPDTTLNQPAAGDTVSGMMQIAGSIADPQGIQDMLFYVDHEQVSVSNLSIGPNFSASLGTSGFSNGPHTLQILAFDDHPTNTVVTLLEQPIVIGAAGQGPEIDAFLNWNSQPIPDGGVYQMGQSTPPGVTISRRFRIENNGDGALTIQNPGALVNHTCFSQRDPIASTITAGGQAFFWLDLNCPQGGTYETDVTILSNDTDESPYTFLVRGFVDQPPPEIRVLIQGHSPANGEVDGGSYTFPSVILPWANPQIKTFSICNDGQGPLAIDNANDLIDRTNFVPFWIDSPPPSTVAAGQCVHFDVKFVTTFAGSYSAQMRIQNNDANEDPFDLTLHGTAGL